MLVRQRQPKRVSMCTATSKTTGAGLPKPLGAHITVCPGCQARSFRISCPPCWVSILPWAELSYFLFLPSGIETFTLCLSHLCILESCRFLIFIGAHSCIYFESWRKLWTRSFEHYWDSYDLDTPGDGSTLFLHCEVDISVWRPGVECHNLDLKCLSKAHVLEA